MDASSHFETMMIVITRNTDFPLHCYESVLCFCVFCGTPGQHWGGELGEGFGKQQLLHLPRPVCSLTQFLRSNMAE